MGQDSINRRHFIGGVAGLGVAAHAPGVFAQQLKLPASPLTISIIDVGGALALVQTPLENYAKANPKAVSRMVFTKAPAPELPAKLKAQQNAGRSDIDFVIGGLDVLSAGIDQKLWIELFPRFAAELPKPDDILLKPALAMHNLGQGQAMAMVYYPSGPLLEYMPDKVKNVPTTAEELLAWTKQNKNRFLYARPANSGPGRTWIMGLPYILGDKDPKDPEKGWDKTWAYLKELGTGVDYYPGGTAATMKELGEGTRDVIVSTLGWDINPRVLGIVPKEAKVFVLANTHWIPDTQFMCIPKGVPADKMPALVALMAHMLKPEAQAVTYDKGYFYPGPAVKGVTLAMAPQESRDILAEYGRPEYDGLITSLPTRPPLTPERLVAAFRRWDQEIGVGHGAPQ